MAAVRTLKTKDVQWTPKNAKRIIALRLELGMRLAVVYAVGQVKLLLNETQPYRRTDRGTLVGLSPSKPGKPPKAITRALFQSITYKVKRDRRRIRAWFGSNLIKARRLELGFVGTDSLGRKIHQEARPFLRPIIRMSKHKRRMMKALKLGAERKVSLT